jgi:hypothetical protein
MGMPAVLLGRIGPSVGFGALNAWQGRGESDAALLSSGLLPGPPAGAWRKRHAGFCSASFSSSKTRVKRVSVHFIWTKAVAHHRQKQCKGAGVRDDQIRCTVHEWPWAKLSCYVLFSHIYRWIRIGYIETNRDIAI